MKGPLCHPVDVASCGPNSSGVGPGHLRDVVLPVRGSEPTRQTSKGTWIWDLIYGKCLGVAKILHREREVIFSLSDSVM